MPQVSTLHTYDGTQCSLTHIVANSIVDGIAKDCLSQAAGVVIPLPGGGAAVHCLELLPSHRNEECCQQVCHIQRP